MCVPGGRQTDLTMKPDFWCEVSFNRAEEFGTNHWNCDLNLLHWSAILFSGSSSSSFRSSPGYRSNIIPINKTRVDTATVEKLLRCTSRLHLQGSRFRQVDSKKYPKSKPVSPSLIPHPLLPSVHRKVHAAP